jgi:ribosomal protein S18 acetylase RimI-like enzyme
MGPSQNDSGITVRGFMPGDEVHFRRLNEEWLLRYFAIEPKDAHVLANPRESILDCGGRIFFAISGGGEPVGCCALLALGAGEYEVAKMAVTASCQRMGAGRRLLETAIKDARALSASRLYLETNRTLGPAIRLYESLGFRHLPPERIVPSAYARADVYMELFL